MPEPTLIYAKITVVSEEQKSKNYKNNYKLLFHNSRFSEDKINCQKSIFTFLMY